MTDDSVVRLRKAYAHVQRARVDAYDTLKALNDGHRDMLETLICEVMDDLDQALAMLEPST